MAPSLPASPRQTQSFLMRRFEEAGIRPETRHGQNFLIDLNLLDLLVRTADIGKSDVVLEVGTGLGSLTTRLAEKAAAVVTVEIDPRLYQLASEELAAAAKEATGISWQVRLTDEGGAPSLQQQEAMAEERMRAEVLDEPNVRALLDEFPEATLESIERKEA